MKYKISLAMKLNSVVNQSGLSDKRPKRNDKDITGLIETAVMISKDGVLTVVTFCATTLTIR